MVYLVTGGAGFIGSNLVKRLMAEGNDVFVIDGLSTGSLDNLVSARPLGFYGSYQDFLANLPSIDFAGIFHLGMPSSSPLYRRDRTLVAKVIDDFLSLLDFARSNQLKIVFASSSSVYNGNPLPWTEDLPVLITDFYTDARYYVERLATLYHDFYGVKSIGLRLFSVYGPGEEAKKQYANLLTQVLWSVRDSKPFTVYGDGEQTRDLTYVDDTVDAFILAMQSDVEYGFFNIGTGKAYSLNEIIELLGAKAEYIENPLKNYVDHTLADTKKAKTVLGFEARYSLAEGISKLQKHMKEAVSP